MTIESMIVQAVTTLRRQIKEELLEELRSEIAISPDRTISFAEACEYLQMSEYTLRRLCREKRIPHRTYGADGSKNPRYWFSTASLDRWIREQEELNYQVKGRNEAWNT
ncbi:helix-turn-helix domain-containing protein [Brevibacillus agri]|uniref:helix-turn-helix domain-containing protein n=1 Tax=Brevibacillus agri TaxID=51101 RepID=UPI002E227A95|nr:helix-turn-helix domain-containing protein [Brevibacillus agri]MED1653875.1 helix-turn-helix domain-containing protein [Brevibacillus agri]MED1686714.1 helix-turn-helix domain-containing protein [Brevibacillus agri]MED1691973.1 helix-turn-helix domain-containing protein [Brevibacillus agri]MED1696030.1 helix-turn-helix domain-containing protein [Brevibacillus agri]